MPKDFLEKETIFHIETSELAANVHVRKDGRIIDGLARYHGDIKYYLVSGKVSERDGEYRVFFKTVIPKSYRTEQFFKAHRKHTIEGDYEGRTQGPGYNVPSLVTLTQGFKSIRDADVSADVAV